jgi:opacity protein-like surface antigen
VVLSYRPEYSSRIDPQTNVVESGAGTRLRSLATLASLYYDFPVSWRFKPYAGGGLGLANNHFSVDSIVRHNGNRVAGFSESNTHFAWQLGGGFALQVGSVVLDLGYRYFDGGTVALGQKLQGQEFQLSIRLPIG